MRIAKAIPLAAVIVVGFFLLSCESVSVEGPSDGGGGGNVTVASVTVSPSTFTIAAGSTQQLSATVRGSDGNIMTNKTVSWTSSSNSVATVSSAGLVTGVAPGSVTVTASVDGKAGTSAGTVGNPTPIINSLSPASGNYGQDDITLTVSGSGFVQASEVRVDGVARTTQFISGTELRTTIQDTELQTIGSLQITVFNPSPGGGSSSAVAFEVGACEQGTLSVDGSENGTIATGDCRFDDGTYFHTWDFTATAGNLYQVRMASDDFDTYLIIADPDGDIVAGDDDGGVETNSRSTFKALSSGTYLVFANTFDAGERGPYDIYLSQPTELDLGSSSPSMTSVQGEAAASPALGDGPFRVEGVPADRYGFWVDYESVYMAQAVPGQNSSLDAAMEMFEVAYNPVGGNNDTDPVFGASNGGELVVAQSEDDRYGSLDLFAAGGTSGNYELFVQECRFFELNLGNTATGTLSPSTDCVLLASSSSSSQYAAVVIGFWADEGDGIVLAAASNWDNDLLLMAPDGGYLARDFGGAGDPAVISGTVPDDGLYMAVLSTWDSGVSGTFAVSLGAYSGVPAQPAPGMDVEMRPGKGLSLPTQFSDGFIRKPAWSPPGLQRTRPPQKPSLQERLEAIGFFKLNLSGF